MTAEQTSQTIRIITTENTNVNIDTTELQTDVNILKKSHQSTTDKSPTSTSEALKDIASDKNISKNNISSNSTMKTSKLPEKSTSSSTFTNDENTGKHLI